MQPVEVGSIVGIGNHVHINYVGTAWINSAGQRTVVSILKIQILTSHTGPIISSWCQCKVVQTVYTQHVKYACAVVNHCGRCGVVSIKYLARYKLSLYCLYIGQCGIVTVDLSRWRQQKTLQIIKIHCEFKEYQLVVGIYRGCHYVREKIWIDWNQVIGAGITDHDLEIVYQSITEYRLVNYGQNVVRTQGGRYVGLAVDLEYVDIVAYDCAGAAVINGRSCIEEESGLQHATKIIFQISTLYCIHRSVIGGLYQPGCICIDAIGILCIVQTEISIDCQIAGRDHIPGIGKIVVAQSKILIKPNLCNHCLLHRHRYIGSKHWYNLCGYGTCGHKIVQHHRPYTRRQVAQTFCCAGQVHCQWTGPDCGLFIGVGRHAYGQTIGLVKVFASRCRKLDQAAFGYVPCIVAGKGTNGHCIVLIILKIACGLIG